MQLLVAVLVGWLLVGTALAARRRWRGVLPADPPGPRKAHARPVPLVGIPLIAAVAVAVGWCGGPHLLPGLLIVAVAGAWDDLTKCSRGGLRWWQKGLALALACGLLAAQVSDTPWQWVPWLAFAFVVTNALNFLDNTDGVCAALAIVGLSVVPAAWSEPVVGLVAGFLLWNWPQARAFIGDCGALSLGYLLAAHALAIRTQAPLALLAPVALPLLDFAQVVVARLLLGFPPWIGDRRHLTHVLQNAGIPAFAVAPLAAALACVLAWSLLRL